jgi:trehalose 2-sulfotransferase
MNWLPILHPYRPDIVLKFSPDPITKENPLRPTLSYTIWFSQRTGSTLLCKALESTGLAGKPKEWLSADSLEPYQNMPNSIFQQRLWQMSSTSNGVSGFKVSFYEPHISTLLQRLRQFPGENPPAADAPRPLIWEHAFPNHRHIFMTRRNKVRLAVSWWKAIQTQEWHRASSQQSGPQSPPNLADAYHFDAINQLYTESMMREAGIQEFFSEASIVPLTVVYEDFIFDYAGTVRSVLKYLGLDDSGVQIAPPYFARLADDISEAWAQRFRQERQSEWDNRGW